MTTTAEVQAFLERFAPARLAEEWDNVGLLVGDATRSVRRIMTCLTITPTTAVEAIREQADLIVSHHPLPFKPLKRITTQSIEGQILWQLIGAQIGIYSPHTAFDSAAQGINQMLAEGLGLADIRPLVETPAGKSAGRIGRASPPRSLAQVLREACAFLKIASCQAVGAMDRRIGQIAFACGSGGTFLDAAKQAGCDLLITGEARFHSCLEAEAGGVALALVGHYPSERFGVERLAETLSAEFPSLAVWASRDERDPLTWCAAHGS